MVLKLTDGHTARIPLAKLSADDQAFVNRARSEVLSDPFAVGSESHSDPVGSKLAAPALDGRVRTVMALGIGTTTEEAKKDAYRDAVRQVVGTLVAPATLVQNDTLIDEKVLSLSGGFVERIEMMAGFPKRDGDLWRVKIKAEVRVTEVVATLGKENVTTLAVRSDDLEAQRITIADQQTAKLDALNDPRMWENFPAQFFTLTVTEQPKVIKAGPEKSALSYTVEIAPDLEAYKRFADKLAGVLGKTSGKQGEFANDGLRPNCEPNQVQNVFRMLWNDFFRSSDGLAASLLSQRDSTDFRKRLEDIEPSASEAKGYQYFCFDQGGYMHPTACGLDRIGKQSWGKVWERKDTDLVLCLLAEANKSSSKTRWQWFVCDRADFPAGAESPWLRGIECEITFLDERGQFVATDAFAVGNGMGVSRYGETNNAQDGGMIFVSPFWIQPKQTGNVWDRKGYVARASFYRVSELDSAEVRNVKAVRCRVKAIPIASTR